MGNPDSFLFHLVRIPLLAIALLGLGGCAGNHPPGGAPPYSATAVSVDPDMRSDVVVMALAQLGVRYRYGGAAPATGFDCSGLVRYVFETAADTPLPHSTRRLAELGRPISRRKLSPGDLVFFNTLHRRYSHVGIYLGDGRFVDAPSSGGAVRIDSLRKPYYAERFDGARTLFGS